MKNVYTNNTMIIGDFNFDCKSRFDVHHRFADLFRELDGNLSDCDLVQIIGSDTWFRVVNHPTKSSVLDHLCIRDLTMITDLRSATPTFDDHLLIINFIKPCEIYFMMSCHSLFWVGWLYSIVSTNWQVWTTFWTRLWFVVTKFPQITRLNNRSK